MNMIYVTLPSWMLEWVFSKSVECWVLPSNMFSFVMWELLFCTFIKENREMMVGMMQTMVTTNKEMVVDLVPKLQSNITNNSRFWI